MCFPNAKCNVAKQLCFCCSESLVRPRVFRTARVDHRGHGISSARAIPAAEPALQKAWIIIQGNPRRQKVFINGHTDSVANDAVNQPLSEQRAQAVADWFIKHGYLTRAMIVPQGFGKTQPIAPTTTAAGRAKNRRRGFPDLNVLPGHDIIVIGFRSGKVL